MSINDTIHDETASLELINPVTPLAHIELLVKRWDSCALKAVSEFNPNSSLYLSAVKVSYLSASHAFSSANINNWIYVLVQCAQHHDLAEQLIQHPHPVVRTACTKHHDLAYILKDDVNDYVRNACCQWGDILELIIDDPSSLVRSRQIANSKNMALYYLKNGTQDDRIIALKNWDECRSIVLNSAQDPLFAYTKQLSALMDQAQ